MNEIVNVKIMHTIQNVLCVGVHCIACACGRENQSNAQKDLIKMFYTPKSMRSGPTFHSQPIIFYGNFTCQHIYPNLCYNIFGSTFITLWRKIKFYVSLPFCISHEKNLFSDRERKILWTKRSNHIICANI